MVESSSNQLLQIVAPAFNESECIEQFVDAIDALLKDLSGRYRGELIIVVERSEDDTFEICCGLAATRPWLKVIHLSRHFGHQLALKAGLDHADADLVVMMDSDLQHPPEVVHELITLYEAGNNIVFTQKQGRHNSLVKTIVSHCYYGIIRRLSHTNILPNSSDFRLIDRKVLKLVQEMNEYDPFLRGIFSWMGFTYSVVTYRLNKRAAGTEKYTWRRLVHLGIAGITSSTTFPLSVGIYLGIACLFISASVLVVFTIWFIQQQSVSWNMVIVLLILFFGSLQLFLVGTIGEYVGRVFLEQKRRPLYLVDKTIGFGSDAE